LYVPDKNREREREREREGEREREREGEIRIGDREIEPRAGEQHCRSSID
jgi:hypothetical protein